MCFQWLFSRSSGQRGLFKAVFVSLYFIVVLSIDCLFSKSVGTFVLLLTYVVSNVMIFICGCSFVSSVGLLPCLKMHFV